MRGNGRLFEGTRMFSIVAAIGLAGGALAFLFHDVDAVAITLAGPGYASPDQTLVYEATIVVPAGQRLPVAGVSLVVQDPGSAPPRVIDLATCWSDLGCDEPRHLGPQVLPGIAIERVSASAPPTVGPLSVWVEGFGRSPATGYGTEVEPQRKLTAGDLTDEAGRSGHGLGYGGDEPVTLVYQVRLDTAELGAGDRRLALLVETGSLDMGAVSGPQVPLLVENA